MKNKLFSALALISAIVIFAGTAHAGSPQTGTPGVLKVAFNGDMPMTGQDANGNLIGTDGSLMVLIAENLGLKVEPHLMEWSAEIQSTKQG